MSQVASAQPLIRRSVTSGRADVVKSRSLWSRPSIASRTGPPTRAISSPAAAKRLPSSSVTGAIRASSATTRAWTSVISRGSSDTRDDSIREERSSGRRWPGPASPGRAHPLDSIAAVRSTRLATRALAVVTLAVTTLTGPGLAVTGAAATSGLRAAEEADPTPLSVTMTLLSPSTMPAKGVITMSGTVRNDSTEDWTDINVAPFVSSTPITTRDELAEAAASAPDAAVGDRLTDPGLQVLVGDLAPDQEATFTVRVRVDALPISGAPGVYWIGVHALGTGTAGRDRV